MKNNLEGLLNLISRSITACGQDFATADVRGHLLAALRAAEKVSKKRIKRQTPLEEMVAKGKSFHEKWWEQVQENVRKAVEKSKQEKREEENSETSIDN
jgi:hypothetical protein